MKTSVATVVGGRARGAGRTLRLPGLPGPVLPLALLAVSLSTLGDPRAWELELVRLGAEPWRVLTGHLVHWTGEHLVWDLAVFVGLGVACERLSRRATALALAVPAVGLGSLLLTPELAVYRGLSGLDAALFALLAVRCWSSGDLGPRVAGGVAFGALAAKVVWELSTGVPLFVAALDGVSVVPAAHLMGAMAGALAGGSCFAASETEPNRRR